MKNKILDFTNEEIDLFDDGDIYEVPDYFSKKIQIADIIDDLQDYLDIYQCADNDKLERISFELYGTTDYWDIIVLLNERSVFFDMPFDSNVLHDLSNNYSSIYIYNTGLNSQERITALNNQWYDETDEINEKNRLLLVPKPHLINEVIKILKTNNYI